MYRRSLVNFPFFDKLEEVARGNKGEKEMWERIRNKKAGGDREQMMTKGPIARQIILFSIPLLLGNLFQQLYNTADSIIVGNYVGKGALAAVGSSASVINLMVGAFMGISIGAGVVISQYYGAKDEENLSEAVHTTMAFGIVTGILLMIIGIAATPAILRWMGTPDSVIDSSILYFRIFFAGSLGASLYNMGCGILRAVGDSRRPLYFLIVASVLNILLDLLFVAKFHWGVAGAAFATIVSQFLSAILTILTLMRTNNAYRVCLRKIRFHWKQLRQIVNIGLPSAIQNAIVSFSNVVVQSNINSFGDIAMAGCGAYMKVDGFAILPVMSFSMAITTFVGQNMGAKEYERVKKGSDFGILASMITVQALACLVIVFAPQIIKVFNGEPEVIAYGARMAKCLGPFYFLAAVSHGVAGALRGAGISKIPMFVIVICWCVLRVAWLAALVPLTQDIGVVFFGYPVTWFASALILLIYYKKADWIHYMDRK
jgi:putative MATE family efflux protein